MAYNFMALHPLGEMVNCQLPKGISNFGVLLSNLHEIRTLCCNTSWIDVFIAIVTYAHTAIWQYDNIVIWQYMNIVISFCIIHRSLFISLSVSVLCRVLTSLYQCKVHNTPSQ